MLSHSAALCLITAQPIHWGRIERDGYTRLLISPQATMQRNQMCLTCYSSMGPNQIQVSVRRNHVDNYLREILAFLYYRSIVNKAPQRMSTTRISRPRWLSWMRRPTGDQEVAGSTPAEVGNILSWRLIMKYFLRSFSPFR